MKTPTEQPAASPALPLLQAWGQLSEAETRAIETGDWDEVDRLQNEKSRLQEQLSQLNPTTDSDQDREWASYLISLEAHNRALVEKGLNAIQLQMDTDSRSLNNMHNVQRAYVHAPRQGASSLQQYS